MPYDDLVGTLRRGLDPVSVGAFPDGSVDDYYRIRDGEETVDSRAAFTTAIDEGRDSFRLEHVATTPGGQAVNAARQAASLGDRVTLAGHLNHPILDFEFDAVSMGAPARVNVYLLGADDMMLVERSADLVQWTFADLRAALGDRVASFLECDALCCTNWSSVPGLGDAVEKIAARTPDGGIFCLDPGTITTQQAGDLLEGVRVLEDAYDVVLSVNREEANRLAESAGTADQVDDPAEAGDLLERIRTAAAVSGVVVHAEDAATAATPTGAVSVRNLDTPQVLTATGAGDRFSAALARSLAAGWDWERSLAMGNACASYYVAEGETADPIALREYVSECGGP